MSRISRGVRFSRAVRKEHVLHELRNSSSTWHSARTIAKLIGINPSMHLYNMLDELAEDGRLTVEEWEPYYIPGQVTTRRMYALPHRAKKQPINDYDPIEERRKK